jgi:hypothetical protein
MPQGWQGLGVKDPLGDVGGSGSHQQLLRHEDRVLQRLWRGHIESGHFGEVGKISDSEIIVNIVKVALCTQSLML